jgi:hypothetical protein
MRDMRITRIEGESNLLRDMKSNAVLYKTDSVNSAAEKRTNFLRNQTQDINNLKEEVSDLRIKLDKILEILQTRTDS